MKSFDIQVLIDVANFQAYCMAVHPLQPHLVASGTNFGVILSEFDARALPAAVSLVTPAGSKEHSVVFSSERELRLLTFQLAAPTNPTVSNTGVLIELNGRPRNETPETPQMQVVLQNCSSDLFFVVLTMDDT